MENKPIMFVNTISDINKAEEELYFDSRKKDSIKPILKHRIDDINALLSLNRIIYVKLISNDKITLGTVNKINSKIIKLMTNFGEKEFDIKNIAELKIEKTMP